MVLLNIKHLVSFVLASGILPKTKHKLRTKFDLKEFTIVSVAFFLEVTGLPLVREKSGKFKVREKSGNFEKSQGNSEF